MCPGCGIPVPVVMFLCLVCAGSTPDALIVTIGAAIDGGDDAAAVVAIGEAVELLNGG